LTATSAITTFPRTGNAAFSQLLAGALAPEYAPALRVKHGADPVCAVIPPVMGYAHFGSELQLGDPDPLPEVPNMLRIADHDIAAYVHCLVTGDAPGEPATKDPVALGVLGDPAATEPLATAPALDVPVARKPSASIAHTMFHTTMIPFRELVGICLRLGTGWWERWGPVWRRHSEQRRVKSGSTE
jgi:hypothetical protein